MLNCETNQQQINEQKQTNKKQHLAQISNKKKKLQMFLDNFAEGIVIRNVLQY